MEEKDQEVLWMTVNEISKITGKCGSAVRETFQRHGIMPKVMEGNFRQKYPVTRAFLELKVKGKSTTHVTIDDLVKETHVSSTTVRKRLKQAGIQPVETGLNHRQLFRYDKSLIDIIKAAPPRVVRRPSVEKLVNPEDFGDAAPILLEEREKKAWVGKQGRLVSNGAIYAQGTIESVSCCGAVVAGRQGRLYELQLV